MALPVSVEYSRFEKLVAEHMLLNALIIGGGPAGATTALLLAEAGWTVGLVEKKNFPRRKVCGEFISATSLPLLQKLGLAEFYLTHCGPEVRRVGLYAAESILTTVMPSANDSLNKWGRALGREHLDTALLNKAKIAGANIWQPGEVVALQRKADLFVCTMSETMDCKEITTPLVVMAHGSWGRQIWQEENKAHTPSDLLAFKAHFRQVNLDFDLMPLLVFPGGYGGLVHSDDQRVTLSCCIRRDKLQQLRQDHPGLQAGDTVLEYIKTSCRGVREALSTAEREGRWLATGPIQPGIRTCYQDHIFYVGNIAGEAHPIVAEGISMAMQSAWLLSQTLIERSHEILAGRGMDDAGAYYSKQWRKHFINRIHAAALFSQLAMMRPRVVSLLLPLFKRFPSILTLGAKWSGKIQQVVPIE